MYAQHDHLFVRPVHRRLQPSRRNTEHDKHYLVHNRVGDHELQRRGIEWNATKLFRYVFKYGAGRDYTDDPSVQRASRWGLLGVFLLLTRRLSMSCATHRVHGRVAGLFALILAGGAGAGRSAEPPQRYALVLGGAPLARQVFAAPAPRAALSTPAAETKRQELLKAQNDLKTVLGQHRIAVTGSVHILANAVFVTASPDRLAELGALPGVAAVIPMPALRRKLNKALSLVNASAAWTAAGGAANSGAGIKIAILDTGIDETHPGFQDPLLSMPAGFPVSGNADDATHTSNKIIAVRSFVSLLAIGDGTPEWTRPDDLSARDRVGHGTAVAMAAAGVSHQSPIGAISGVAPKAWLGNYKIFGSPGVNDSTSADVVLEALEAAFGDGMDVALVSAGDIGAVWSPTNQGADCGRDWPACPAIRWRGLSPPRAWPEWPSCSRPATTEIRGGTPSTARAITPGQSPRGPAPMRTLWHPPYPPPAATNCPRGWATARSCRRL